MNRSNLMLALLIGIGIVVCFAYLIIEPIRERAEHEATFLRQCAEAGYDVAKCQFFLTATGSTNNAATMQVILQATTPN